MTEPDVALSDYGLALECLIFAGLIVQRPGGPPKKWFLSFFVSVGLASLFGGTVHGFFADEGTRGYRILWPATLVAIGWTALSGWGVGAAVLFREKVRRRVVRAATLVFVVYCGIVLFVSQEFLTAVVHYLPASVVLLVAFSRVYWLKRSGAALAGAVGMALTFVAAWVQQAGISVHPVYFTHNTFYHALQAVALFLIYRFASRYSNFSKGDVP